MEQITNEITHTVGRTAFIEELKARLNKNVPDNISLIAPPKFGKSCIVEDIQCWAKNESQFRIVIDWRLSHDVPTSDEDFLRQLSQKFSSALLKDPDLRGWADDFKDVEDFQSLKDFMVVLAEEGLPVLFLWDGLDKPLKRNYLTVGLWDSMRTLLSIAVHGIVVATREPLSDLIDDDVAQSQFWNIFTRKTLPPFDETACGENLRDYSLNCDEPGVLKEVHRQTGGIPLLVCAMAKALKDVHGESKLSAKNVQEISEEVYNEMREDYLEFFWAYCDELKDSYKLLVRKKAIPMKEAQPFTNRLVGAGLATKHKGELKPAGFICNMYFETQPDNQFIQLDFGGDEKKYVSCMRLILLQRWEQIKPVQNKAYNLLKTAINVLSDDPSECWAFFNSIHKQVLDKIIELEFGSSSEFPNNIQHEWGGHKDLPNFLAERFDNNDFTIPKIDWQRLKVIQLLTGCDNKFDDNIATYTNKRTWHLLSALKTLRNFDQHKGGEPLPSHLAITGLMLAVELMESIQPRN